ncbi:MAG: hypothetical protein C0603_12925 [Denitrovibrio sp.]|nr:MAG: hypothetical protein C0603_12925 [Denitrovibrio sp.]
MRKLFILLTILLLSTTYAMAESVYTNLQTTAINAGVENEAAMMLAERVKLAKFSEANVIKIQSTMTALQKNGAGKVAEKVLEGIAKNVDQTRIIFALERVQNRYEKAMQIANMLGDIGTKSIRISETIADAMSAGATDSGLAKIADQIKASDKYDSEYAESAFTLYRDVVRYGVDNNEAYSITKNAMEKFSASEMNIMRRDIAKNAGNNDSESLAGKIKDSIESGNAGMSGESGSSGGSGNGSGGGGNGNSKH